MNQTTWVEVSRSALLSNLRLFQRLIAPAAVMPIIKSNAYGHDLFAVGRILKTQKIWGVGVANTTEALALRQSGFHKPIVVLNWANESELAAAIKAHLQLPVYNKRFAARLERLGKQHKTKIAVHLKYDSGTTRLGLYDKDFLKLAAFCNTLPHLVVRGIFSHLAESESENQAYTKQQLQHFENIRQQIVALGVKAIAHIACTAATITQQKSHYDVARVGIGLYGLWPSTYLRATASKKLLLKPVLSWRTKIIQVKAVPAKTPIGYGRTYTTKRQSRIAVLPVGYWDGLDRSLSNRGQVLINGIRCPIRGRICMNLTMIDVTKIPSARTGTVVTLIGRSGRGAVTADDIAANSDTINYETITRINPIIPRIITV